MVRKVGKMVRKVGKMVRKVGKKERKKKKEKEKEKYQLHNGAEAIPPRGGSGTDANDSSI